VTVLESLIAELKDVRAGLPDKRNGPRRDSTALTPLGDSFIVLIATKKTNQTSLEADEDRRGQFAQRPTG
jgi:hypothetical protein